MHDTLLTQQSPTFLLADVGLPMIFLTLPLMIGALIPVILLEILITKPLLGMGYGKTAWVVSVANVISTLAGVPLAWIAVLLVDYLLFFVGMHLPMPNVKEGPVLEVIEVILFPAWNGGPDEPGFYWVAPVATIALLIPSFFASWYIEALTISRMVKSEWPLVRSASLKANLVSYAFLLLAGGAWLAVSLLIHHRG
jgi:hypothetical protein